MTRSTQPSVESLTPPDAPLKLSFRYLDTTHPLFDVGRCETMYFHLLLSRLREISQLRVAEFRILRSHALRLHRIEFADGRVSVEGFGVPGRPQVDRDAWQFSLSANEHGRVHGFLVRDTFYIRWLDPDHRLYAGN